MRHACSRKRSPNGRRSAHVRRADGRAAHRSSRRRHRHRCVGRRRGIAALRFSAPAGTCRANASKRSRGGSSVWSARGRRARCAGRARARTALARAACARRISDGPRRGSSPAAPALLEPDPPGRLKTEPSVFGGVPGAADFRRCRPARDLEQEAMRRCGGRRRSLVRARARSSSRECGLAPRRSTQFEARAASASRRSWRKHRSPDSQKAGRRKHPKAISPRSVRSVAPRRGRDGPQRARTPAPGGARSRCDRRRRDA